MENDSDSPMWVASMHPTPHSLSDDWRCLGSTFDACKNMGVGESYSFNLTSQDPGNTTTTPREGSTAQL